MRPTERLRRRTPAGHLRGRVVVVGATSGVGRATALSLAAHGCQLVLAARSATALDDVVARCGSAGAKAIAVPTDIGRLEDVEELARAATECERVAAASGAEVHGQWRRGRSRRRLGEAWGRALAGRGAQGS